MPLRAQFLCLRTQLSCAYVLTCPRVLLPYVLMCQRALRAYVVTWQCAFRAYVLTCCIYEFMCVKNVWRK